MKPLRMQDVRKYVKKNIGEFHARRLEKVHQIKLSDVLKSKNPYLFKAKNVTRASDIIENILSAYLSSSEEGIFGNWLERLAIHVNQLVYNGQKAGVPGIDLDFYKNKNRYLVTIKSGPAWGNDSQITRMIENFSTARKRLKTSGAKVNVVFVNGCCYGRSNPTSEYKIKGDYYKMCGQRFWELISGDPDLYTQLIEPIGYEALERNEEFKRSYDELINKLTKEFLDGYSDPKGGIDWKKLVVFNSGPGSLELIGKSVKKKK